VVVKSPIIKISARQFLSAVTFLTGLRQAFDRAPFPEQNLASPGISLAHGRERRNTVGAELPVALAKFAPGREQAYVRTEGQ
jgi:hypothetical protein